MVDQVEQDKELFCSCPGCSATFRVSIDKLTHRDGMVRCGVCRKVFDANLNLLQKTRNGFVHASHKDIEETSVTNAADSFPYDESDANTDSAYLDHRNQTDPEQTLDSGIKDIAEDGNRPHPDGPDSSGKAKSDLLVSALESDDEVPIQDIRNPFEERKSDSVEQPKRVHGERAEPTLVSPPRNDHTPNLTIPDDYTRTQRNQPEERQESVAAPAFDSYHSKSELHFESSHDRSNVNKSDPKEGSSHPGEFPPLKSNQTDVADQIVGSGVDEHRVGQDTNVITPTNENHSSHVEPEVHREIELPQIVDPFKGREDGEESSGPVQSINGNDFALRQDESVDLEHDKITEERRSADAHDSYSDIPAGNEKRSMPQESGDSDRSEPQFVEIPDDLAKSARETDSAGSDTTSAGVIRGPNFSDPARRRAYGYIEPDTVPLEEDEFSLQENDDPSEVTHTETLNMEESTLGRMHKNGVEEYIAERKNPFSTFVWLLVAGAFLVLLGLQVKYFMIEEYAQDERYRKYLTGFCKIAQCVLPPRQDPYLLTLTHTKIDLHPTQPGALRVTVKMVNEASFSQPYPILQLTLTDRVGRIVGRRTFTPQAYLPEGSSEKIGEGELASILFDLARPHEKAVGFVVDIVTETAES